jgi:hypothetical protein
MRKWCLAWGCNHCVQRLTGTALSDSRRRHGRLGALFPSPPPSTAARYYAGHRYALPRGAPPAGKRLGAGVTSEVANTRHKSHTTAADHSAALRSLQDIRPLYILPADPLAEEVLIPGFRFDWLGVCVRHSGAVSCSDGYRPSWSRCRGIDPFQYRA